MAPLPKPFLDEIQALTSLMVEDEPNDWLQYCADYFNRKLSTERKTLLAASQSAPTWPLASTRNPSAPLQAPQPLQPIHQRQRTPSPPPSQSQQSAQANMASPFTVTSPFSLNTNPFGGASAPSDAVSASSGMQRVIEEEEADTLTSPTAPRYGIMSAANAPTSFRAPFGGSEGLTDSLPPSARAPNSSDNNYPDRYTFTRRTSVSAESLKPSADTNDNWSPPYHEKTPEQLERLKRAIGSNFLFSHLDDEQNDQVLGALVEKPIPAKGIKVISQGDAGDYFYVVEKGSFDIYIHKSGTLQPGPDGMGDKVSRIEAGGGFGELALMYNAPRAATVVSAVAQCTLWALDRVTFRRILMESTFARRRMYESFLEEVPLLKSLTSYECSRIADALHTEKYSPGTTIIKEGERGDKFYLLESGTANAIKGHSGNVVMVYHKGDYFGELALLNDAPRAATIVACDEVKVATLDKSAFERLLGPVKPYLRGTKYEEYIVDDQMDSL